MAEVHSTFTLKPGDQAPGKNYAESPMAGLCQKGTDSESAAYDAAYE